MTIRKIEALAAERSDHEVKGRGSGSGEVVEENKRVDKRGDVDLKRFQVRGNVASCWVRHDAWSLEF